ncbi:hypothetical protein BA065_01935 [Nanoarchaeota archaeon NZ13-N]|uniref:Uncharacterized protein n=1 Tax=Candidatus Nanoclepta minutus TaxID=1940235 RepID=A0A397WRB3_9ARCH|nr:MAG: hypothetical protein BA065_01935 [Nanoarchaeota archaeon NZ13-N]RIB35206.1 MAG: hypothetical protein BXU00_02660 [Candidatus Nanoclepta minutus]
MKVELLFDDKDFIESVRFLEDKESIRIMENCILIEKTETSKIRASVNLIMRLAKINEDLGRTLSKL